MIFPPPCRQALYQAPDTWDPRLPCPNEFEAVLGLLHGKDNAIGMYNPKPKVGKVPAICPGWDGAWICRLEYLHMYSGGPSSCGPELEEGKKGRVGSVLPTLLGFNVEHKGIRILTSNLDFRSLQSYICPSTRTEPIFYLTVYHT